MPTIAQDARLQTVITTFEVMPGVCDDVVDLLRAAYAEFIRLQPGFIGSALHVNDAHTRIANYSQWNRREDFLAMLRSNEMRSRNRAISALCKSFEPVMYEVIEAYGERDFQPDEIVR
jgi:heme-degrading monooxygenase HmoA